MPIGTITQDVSTIPAPPHRGVDVQTVFVNKQEDFQDHLADITIDELNTFKDQLNTRIGEINSTATTMNGYADTASAGASTATTKAGEASTSASGALTSRNQAETFKNNASTSASTATTKAGEASASALSASTSASTATTKAGEASASALSASTSASTATTKAGEASASASTATTKASEASASALSASTSASTATTKAGGASASASQALTSRNQAETFAQQASASALSVDVNNIVHRTGAETIAGVKTFSSNIVGNITGNAGSATIAADSNKLVGKNWYWSGQGGQPAWLWGGSDGANMYVYNPANFNVNTAVSLNTVVGSAPSYACRAWVNFNGTGTVAIRASGNVSSITDNGTGYYTVNFTTAMTDVNYSMFAQSGSGNARWMCEYNGVYNIADSSTLKTASSCRVAFIDNTGVLNDNGAIYVSIFR